MKFAKRKKYITFSIEDMFEEMIYSQNDFSHTKKKSSDDVYTVSEFKLIFHYLLQHLDVRNIAILLMFVTGMRVGEVVALQRSDIDLNSLSISINKTERRYKNLNGKYELIITRPKTNASYRTVYVPQNLKLVLSQLLSLSADAEYLISEDDKRLSANAIRMRLRKVCKKLGIKNKSPHKCRKTFASMLLDSEISKAVIIDIMGHTDISTTEKHYHRDRDDEELKIEAINSLKEFFIA